MKVSIIIPALDSYDDVNILLDSLALQTFTNFEVIIVDTSKKIRAEPISKDFNLKESIKYIHFPGAFPGKARNIGVSKADGKLLAFLDVRTIPDINWLSDSLKIFDMGNSLMQGSIIRTSAGTYFQKILRAASYGTKPRQALVGSILSKESFRKIGGFNEEVRAGEDLEWLSRAAKVLRKISWSTSPLISYNGLMLGMVATVKKWYLYSMSSSKINVEVHQKYFYFIILFFISWIFVYSWNPIIAGKEMWSESPYFVPHITKIFTGFLFAIYFLFRGLIRPIKNRTEILFLVPFNWIYVGFLGLILDFVKAPGRLIGLLYHYKAKLNSHSQTQENPSHSKILIVCPNPYGEAAGQRLKYEQYFDDWEKNEFSIEITSFFSKKTWDILYKKGFFAQKLFGTLSGYFRRLMYLNKLRKYDKIYIFMWVTPLFGSLFEKLFRLLSKKIIFDFDDAIHLYKNANDEKKITSFLRSTKKTNYLIEKSDCVITSSPSNLAYCILHNQYSNAFYIPCSLNTKRFKPRKTRGNNKKITLGWTGTFSSSSYLDSIKEILISISKLFDVRILLITNFDYEIKGTNLDVIFWNEETEISDLHEIDIGLYPLIPSNWALGKGGLKVLQYMALGIPSVSTNFGTAQDIIVHGHNGFLAKDSSEWIDHLSALISSSDLRDEIGANARKTIQKKYSVDSVSTKYLNALYSVDSK